VTVDILTVLAVPAGEAREAMTLTVNTVATSVAALRTTVTGVICHWHQHTSSQSPAEHSPPSLSQRSPVGHA